MSVQLTVCPEKYSNQDPPLIYERLRLDFVDYELWKILDSHGTPMTKGIEWYEENGLKRRFDNPYGEEIKFVSIYRFLKLWNEFTKDCELSNWDKGVISLLTHLPADNRLILWFH